MRTEIRNLKTITRPILEDIKIFQKEFDEALRSEVRLINTIARYLVRNRGKHIRPILTILSARLCGAPTLNSYRAAAMIEILHIATLIHDDIVDEARKRRGFPSINRIWKNKVSVLMGDFMFSKVLINLIGLKDFEALALISRTAEFMSSGELLQFERSISRSMTEKMYYDMIFKKTASLISTSCELGAITTTRSPSDRDSMNRYGTKLGMAFQIRDDLFDLLGNEQDTGKDKGSDIRKNLITLPLIHTYNILSRPEQRQIDKILRLKKKSPADLDTLTEIVRDAGGFEYAYRKIDEFSGQALEVLDAYPDSPYKQSLTDLVVYNAQRSK